MKALALTWAGAWREALANRRGFWTQVGFMIVNDVVWVLFWLLFFNRVSEVRGWRVEDVIVLLAIATTGGGWVLGAMNNCRQLGQLIANGELDATLTLPVPTLPHLLARRVETLFLGDVVFGVTLFVLFGEPTPRRLLVFAFGAVCAALIISGFLVLVGSLAFHIGRNEAGDLGFHAILLFSSYPVDVFSGAAKFMLYVVVPAGFVSSVPARLVNEFDPRIAVGVFAVAVGFAVLGYLAFSMGLRRYTSGSLWTRA